MSVLTYVFGSGQRRTRRAPADRYGRLRVKGLEDRTVPSVMVPGLPIHAPALAPAIQAPLQNTGLTQQVTTPIHSVGNLVLQNFAVQDGKLVAHALLGGQSLTIPTTLTRGTGTTCPILHLHLGPLNLNLLGLHVHLNAVTVNITAQSGPGQLLGNLLCGVSHLLDTPNVSSIADTLNGLLTPVTSTIPVSLTGNLAGPLTLNHVSTQGGQLLGSGTLGQLSFLDPLLATTSTAGAAAAPTASTPILNLTVGPIHLDLLGLMIDTNRIHLTITAQSGPGKLLGNLLTDIAHLLDMHVPPNVVSTLLNDILHTL
jgi:hypothetical protein